MTPDTITAAIAESKSKCVTLGFASGGVRVIRESIKPAAAVGYLTARLVQPYGSADPETEVLLDPSMVHYIKF